MSMLECLEVRTQEPKSECDITQGAGDLCYGARSLVWVPKTMLNPSAQKHKHM